MGTYYCFSGKEPKFYAHLFLNKLHQTIKRESFLNVERYLYIIQEN